MSKLRYGSHSKTSIAQFLFNILPIQHKNDFQRKRPIVLPDIFLNIEKLHYICRKI